MSRHVEVRPGVYRDSVTLMQVSRRASSEPGVRSALVAMATELNLKLLGEMGFSAPPVATANDLLVGVDAADERTLSAALAAVDAALTEQHPAAPQEAPSAPHSIRAAGGGANVALISTPGPYAAADAFEALHAGLDVMIFSDNVPVAHEVALKTAAARLGRLVMGPDCGTAVIHGIGLGFANVVRPGPVGIVAASGTGAQQLMCLLDAAGIGISHCVGAGGRDLSTPVAGRTTLAALEALAADPVTKRIVVVSKHPAPEVAERVSAHAAHVDKPVHLGFLGAGRPTITDLAAEVVNADGRPWPRLASWTTPTSAVPPHSSIRGLFCGGTLCEEAALVVNQILGDEAGRANHHQFVDLGAEEHTRGRAHPMIDSSLRIERLEAEAADPDCGVVLVDVVLGHAAHPDPAAELAPVIHEARATAAESGRQLAVVVALVGTAHDPQGLEPQAQTLHDAGASVYLSNAAAARQAAALVLGAAVD